MKQTVLEEKSAGGIVYRKIDGIYEFLIGKHSGYHKWVLPKGHVEAGETPMEAALREVVEEMGVRATVAHSVPLKTIEYDFLVDMDTSGETTRAVAKYQEEGGRGTKIHKQVIFYLMEMENDLGSAGWEMEERKWVSYEEGMELLAFESERDVFGVAGKDLGCL